MFKEIKSVLVLLTLTVLSVLISCGDDGDDGSSVNINISTSTPSDITANSAVLGGNVSGEGVFTAGVVISQTDNPDIENATTLPSSFTSGSFSITATGLSANTTYFVRAFALADGGSAAYGDTKNFTTSEEDNTRPTLVSISPNGTETPVSTTTTITYTFSEPMDLNTFIAPGGSLSNNVYVSGGIYGSDVPFTISASGNDIILTPSVELDGGEALYSYGLFPDDITDLAGNSLEIEAGEGDGSFLTINTPLTITNISPADNDDNVSLDTEIVVTFSKTLDPNLVNADAFTLTSIDGETSGSISVSGNKVTFTPSGELNDFMTYYYFNIAGYGSLQIRDTDGNYFSEEESYTFRGEAFSENYYYEFDGNDGYAADNLDITFNGGTSYTINVSVGSAYESMSWRFVKASYAGNDVYAITNKVVDTNGHNLFIEAAAADDNSKILMASRPSASGWYTGQMWSVEWSGNNSNGFLLKAVVPNAYLSSNDLDINATIASPPYEHEWLVTRRAAYNGN